MADIARVRAEADRMLRAEEAERLSPYLCIAKNPTIGVGCTTYEDGTKVKLTDPPITRERSAALLTHKINEGIAQVLTMAGACSTNQLLGLLILGFNIGWEALRTSTAIKCHRRGDYAAAARAFSLFDQYRPGGPGTPKQRSEALAARRLREAAIYSLPDGHDEAPAPVPQAVEPESKASSSTITRTGATITVGGVVASIQEWGGSITGLKPMLDTARSMLVDTLGIPPGAILPLVMIGCGALVIYWRRRQRAEGWA